MRVLLAVILLSYTVQAESPAKKLTAGKDDKKQYYLIGDPAAAKAKAGFGLVVILPGNDGSAEFLDFCKSIHEEGLPNGYLAVQPVAVKWNNKQEITWPTEASKKNVDHLKFTTEEFIDAILDDVTKAHTIDSKRIFTLSWSSGGPAAYVISLTSKRVTGSFIAMSVFLEKDLKLETAKGKPYFLYHSPTDRICKYSFAEKAKATLEKHGGKVTLVDYDGGHGWHGATHDDIRTGIGWLEAHAAAPKK